MSYSSDSSAEEFVGKSFGQYEILEEVGRGGMATVYRAKQRNINRDVAIKILPRHFLHDPSFLERFKREVDTITRLEHPHILPIYDFGETEGVPYIAMRYLAGGSMAQMIRRGPPPIQDLERPFSQIAQALDYAHRQGIIHRDLKPGNVMMDENGNAYLTDFGIARVMGSDLTGSAIIGTPAYMSPEQANGRPLDARSDVYALGVVLFELVTGRAPYEAETPMAVLLKHISEPMPPLRSFRLDAPVAIESVIERATAKDPTGRFSSAGELSRAFTRALAEPNSLSADPPTLPPAAPMPLLSFNANPATPPPITNLPTATPGAMTPPPTGQGFYQTGQGFGTGTMVPVKSGPSTGVLVAGVIVVLIVVAGIIAGLVLTRDNTLDDPTPVAQLPTPFFGARMMREELYTLSIPNNWSFTDQSNVDRLVNIWQAQDNSAFITLSLVQAEIDDQAEFAEALNDFDSRYYIPQSGELRMIDEGVAPDGTVRRSYRLEGERFPFGQIDVFYIWHGEYLAVLELYSADSTGSDLVPTFQRVLDSLRMTAESG